MQGRSFVITESTGQSKTAVTFSAMVSPAYSRYRDNGNVHWTAANIIVFKSRAARGSMCNVLLYRVRVALLPVNISYNGLEHM